MIINFGMVQGTNLILAMFGATWKDAGLGMILALEGS
jgi:hypothetical protein